MLLNPGKTKSNSKSTPSRRSVNIRHTTLTQLDDNSLRPTEISRERLKQKPLATKRCPSRESKGSGDSGVGNGRNWFTRSNENPGKRSGQMIVDNDPPFFQRNESSVSDDNIGERQLSSHREVQFAPGFIHQATNGSSIDDFRSVIDDLTIENKRLKDRLRKYESSSSIQPEKDKLFEVKVHGLSPRQKRQLEETLRTFASSIVTNDSKAGNDSLTPSKSERIKYSSAVPKLTNGSSSATSDSRRVDSGYASLSTPGPNFSSAVNQVAKDIYAGPVTAKAKAQKVQSFLDDIPRGLHPQQPANMPERTKRKLVVRRLEQLFTGKPAFPRSDNSQALQQQEVSNLAARYDNITVDGKRPEGLREAHILEFEMELDKIEPPKLHRMSSLESTDEKSGSGSDSSSKQRPTRPLDLDPDRLQVPSENMEYIRHLGLSAPELLATSSTDGASDADGWVYLNLLVNMAQLHIVNVTPDFVRSAVSEVSTKFQLSPDGKKIRWRGGTEGTRFSSDSGGDSVQHGSPNDSDSFEESAGKRRRLGDSPRKNLAIEQRVRHGQFSAVPVNTEGNYRTPASTKQRNNFQYKPLFQHYDSKDVDAMSVDESDSHFSLKSDVGGVGRKSGTSGSPPLGRPNGTIVFYSGAPFCVDLSADRDNISTPLHVTDVGKDGFSNHTHDALGCHSNIAPPGPSRTSSGSTLSYRPFKDYSVCANPLRDEETAERTEPNGPENTSDDLEFSPKWAATELRQSVSLLDMDASGLGGSRPADHFVITVKMGRPTVDSKTRTQLSKFSVKNTNSRRIFHSISPASLETFFSPEDTIINRLSALRANSPPVLISRRNLPVKAQLLSTQVRRLRPSTLPPPTTFYSEYSSSDGSIDNTTSESHADTNQTKSTKIQWSEVSPNNEDGMDEDTTSEDNDETTDDDSSIDMLAQAREMDPATVAALERQFEPSESSKSSNATAGHESDVSNSYRSSFGLDES